MNPTDLSTVHANTLHPLLLRRELVPAGVTDLELRAGNRSGELIRVRRGAYLAAADARSIDAPRRYWLVVREVATRSPRLVVSHQSAAELHGLARLGPVPSAVHLTKPGRGGSRRTGLRVVHAARLLKEEIVCVEGVAATSVARTLTDMARCSPFESATVAVDDSLRRGLVSVDELGTALALAAHRPGGAAMRRVFMAADGRAESAGETRARLALQRAGAPPTELQVEVYDDRGVFVGRVDLAYLAGGVLVEFDGRTKYERLLKPGQSVTDAVLAEKKREEGLTELEWLVIRIVWRDLSDPTLMAERIRRAILARKALVGAGGIRGSVRLAQPVRLPR